MGNEYTTRNVEYLRRETRFYKLATTFLVVFCSVLIFVIGYNEIFGDNDSVAQGDEQVVPIEQINYDSFLAEIESMDFISGYTIRKFRDEWDLAVSYDNNGPSLFYYDLTTEEEIFGALEDILRYQKEIRE